MAPFPSGVPNKELDDTAISPKLGITMAGCVLAFLAITAGFLFVARKKRRAPRSSASSASEPSASVQPKNPGPQPHRCTHHHEPVRRGISLPTAASSGRCLVCASQPAAAGRHGFEVPRSSHDSTRSLPPYTRHAAPTAVLAIGPEAPRVAQAITAPTTPPSPPPAYMARGPTASFRRAV
ncbi:hypothetical protein GSI_02880 [Ganoderma sinense ZZ0214-1]|uniref:Uncharacterized protein n=1 Tax=Ganoderma sinense ZZ0214-1 TaxID=1077348 RepID=A0A2G8SMV1_9APHY|nr:hypothetical protein GSI_02880 [Ganoderma sinense ZZ0214-1]